MLCANLINCGNNSTMEQAPFEPNHGRLARVAAFYSTQLRLAREQLATANLNPHEGRLRSSAMPAKYMNIPDFPPVDLDSPEHQ